MYSEQKQALAETQVLKRPAVLAVSGVHNSGKTTLLEKLLLMVRDLGQERTFAYIRFLLGCEDNN